MVEEPVHRLSQPTESARPPEMEMVSPEPAAQQVHPTPAETTFNVNTQRVPDEEIKIQPDLMPEEAFKTSPAKELVEISPPRKSPISLKRAKSTNSIPVNEIE